MFSLNINSIVEELRQSFGQASREKSKRAIKCEIENECIVETDSFPPTDDVIADFQKAGDYLVGV